VTLRRARTTTDSLAIGAGILGSLVMALTAAVASLVYRGRQGESFSPLNHFVSELGELGVSELAWLFNAGLMFGGIAFVVFILGLAATRSGLLRYAYAVTGVIAGIGGSLVGVFPMNDLVTHSMVATTFFVSGLFTVLLGSIDVWRQPDPRFPRWLAVLGVLDALAFAVFNVLMNRERSGLASPESRPDIWPLTIFEWLCLGGILAWTLLASLTWWRATSPRTAAPA
jgi:hypothetical membrane protein